MSDLVLVTGATGFVAQHCILQLLQAGYQVRGTVRSPARAREVTDALSPHLGPEAIERLRSDVEIVTADLLHDDGWPSAAEGCRFVLHVASPLPRTPPRHEDEVIVPARDGALRVLRAAVGSGAERVVMTSSTSAIIYGHDRDRTFTEADWSNLDDRRVGAYDKSKTIAERAAWDYMTTAGPDRTELVTINPGLVLGPLLTADWGTSGEVIKKVIERDFPAIPDLNFAPVDVRDVASAHLAALREPRAAGLRFICAIDNHSLRDIARILDDHLRQRGFKIPTRGLPDAMMRVVSLWDKTARLALNDLGVPQHVDSTRAREILGWRPRDLDDMVTAMADSMIALGVVAAPAA